LPPGKGALILRRDKMSIDLQTFLEKARVKENNKLKVTEIEVKEFGLLEFARPKDSDMMKFMTKITTGNKENIEELTNISKEFVYLSCPMLQKKEVQDEFKIQMPFETPIVLFGFMETIKLANEIFSEFNGIEVVEEVEEEVKN
jgi:hypothetical protein